MVLYGQMCKLRNGDNIQSEGLYVACCFKDCPRQLIVHAPILQQHLAVIVVSSEVLGEAESGVGISKVYQLLVRALFGNSFVGHNDDIFRDPNPRGTMGSDSYCPIDSHVVQSLLHYLFSAEIKSARCFLRRRMPELDMTLRAMGKPLFLSTRQYGTPPAELRIGTLRK